MNGAVSAWCGVVFEVLFCVVACFEAASAGTRDVSVVTVDAVADRCSDVFDGVSFSIVLEVAVDGCYVCFDERMRLVRCSHALV